LDAAKADIIQGKNVDIFTSMPSLFLKYEYILKSVSRFPVLFQLCVKNCQEQDKSTFLCKVFNFNPI
jgi:hypothetical protein